MKKKCSRAFKLLTVCLAISAIAQTANSQCTPAPAGCSGSDFSNSFLNSSNPATIEYDNIVSTFHSSMARQSDGRVIVWGEQIAADGVSHVLTPIELNAANYPGLTGSILRFAAGSYYQEEEQFTVLTTTGLFVWGKPGNLVNGALKSTPGFGSLTVGGNTTGLPAGVNPGNVKMLFGTYLALTIVTCNGDVWMLAGDGKRNGDGSAGNTGISWTRVKINSTTFLSDAVAVRGTYGGMVALKSDGTVWTWGEKVYLGDNTPVSTRLYATQMNIPVGVTPKMIGMTNDFDPSASYAKASTYHLLSTDGRVFGLGYNAHRQVGNYTNIEATTWSQVQKSAASGDYLTNVAWISPGEHDPSNPAVNAITSSGVLYSWGINSLQMLGLPTSGASYNPTANPGSLTAADKIRAVETGGHTSIIIKQCSGQYGYVGHRINGSMGNSTGSNAQESVYNFSQTSVLNLCSASSGAAVLFPISKPVVVGQPVQLYFAQAGGSFTVTGPGSVNASGELTATGVGTLHVVYTTAGSCGSTSSDISVNVVSSLGVVFGDINAKLVNNTMRVDWTTLKEENNSYFEIEASADGDSFSKIGELKTMARDGNSSVSLNYSFSKTIAANALQLGGGLMVLSTLIMSLRKRPFRVVVIAMAASILFLAGCMKKDSIDSAGQRIFVRIAQVDKDGTRLYSKVIKAIVINQ